MDFTSLNNSVTKMVHSVIFKLDEIAFDNNLAIDHNILFLIQDAIKMEMNNINQCKDIANSYVLAILNGINNDYAINQEIANLSNQNIDYLYDNLYKIDLSLKNNLNLKEVIYDLGIFYNTLYSYYVISNTLISINTLISLRESGINIEIKGNLEVIKKDLEDKNKILENLLIKSINIYAEYMSMFIKSLKRILNC